ncbi:MAG: FAD-dependent thymidylate synthase [Armatimonadetes bacterium]|nr:FAD-dependent thymidylate synthase [Armatimonadota bacterium]
MKVYLLAYTPQAEKIVASAAKLCYSSIGAKEILNRMEEKNLRKRIQDCYKKGHHSIFEHAVFTFAIEGISRVASHQLVRHRLASYSQQSQRYVKFTASALYITPPSISSNIEANKIYIEAMRNNLTVYEKLLNLGIKSEDARFIFPQAMETKIAVTMNARELLHFFRLRCCTHAQWEIRTLAYLILKEVKKAAPLIFENAGPSCFIGDCPENDEACLKKMRKSR